MRLDSITPVILTFNEQENLGRTLDSLKWAKQIVIVDSCSSDATPEIAMSHPSVSLYRREFDNHTNQWNFGLAKVVTEWTLAMDADYQCGPGMRRNLESLEATHRAYSVPFRFSVFGHGLRSTLYPNRVSLFLTGEFEYRQDGHTQLLFVPEGMEVGTLHEGFVHDDRKPMSRWLHSQSKYADLEVLKIQQQSGSQLGWKDRIRKHIILAPLLTLIYCLFFKRLILDGWPGIHYTIQRVIAEMILSLKLVDFRLRNDHQDKTPDGGSLL